MSRGLPHFIEDYSATRDIFTRALPLLSLVFVFEMFTALNLDWAWWANVLAVGGGFVLLVGFLAISNVVRRRRVLERPRSVGVPELTLFVLAPPIVPLIFGGKGTLSVATVIINLVLVGVVYVFTSYAVIPTMRWAFIKLWDQLGALTGLLTRALPLLLLFITFLFLNPDTWQVAGHLYGIYFTSTLLLFVLIGTLFVITRLPREIGDLNHFQSAQEVHKEAFDVTGGGSTELNLDAPLSRRQWGNTGFVVLISQAIKCCSLRLLLHCF